MPPTKLLLPITALLIALLVIAACGGDPSTPTPPRGEAPSQPDAPCPTLIPPPCYTGTPPIDIPSKEYAHCHLLKPMPCTPTPQAPDQPWPQPDAETTQPWATPTPVPTPDFDPAAYFAQSDPTGRNPWRTDFSKHSIDYTEILLGQVRDGIPSIDNPKFAPVSDDPDWLADREPVIALQIGGDARAYPLQIMTWHEIVNDIVGGEPVIVTFCPLCNSAIAFERRMGNTINSFGVSGLLRYSDLIMYDRDTDSWWQQLLGEAIVGKLTGTRLPQVPASIISWADFRENYPDGQVLTRDTGFTRQYGRNPYTGYDDIDSSPFLFVGPEDGRLRPVERVAAVELGGESVAYPFLSAGGDPRGQRRHRWDAGSGPLLAGHCVGAGRQQHRLLPGRGRHRRLRPPPRRPNPHLPPRLRCLHRRRDRLDLERPRPRHRRPLEGETLTPIIHANHFWFAWAAFKPTTRVWGP